MKTIIPDLNQFGEKWLEAKIQRMKNLLNIAEPDEALYREIMLSLGYPRNKVQFLELALLLPYKEIKELKEREKIEMALLYRGGFSNSHEGLPHTFDISLKIDMSIWNYKKVRPTNFPEKRIIGISNLLYQTISIGLVNYFIEKMNNAMEKVQTPDDAKNVVQNIMNFSGFGRQRKTELFFNIIFPYMVVYIADTDNKVIQFLNNIFELHPPLSENSITKQFAKINNNENYKKINHSAKTYFGILYYMRGLKYGNDFNY